MVSKLDTISNKVESDSKKYEADLEQALSVVGFGVHTLKYCLLLALFLIGAIVEPLSYSYILPAAKCDLDISDAQRGFISSIPYIAIFLTSFPWGYLVDTRGRKPMLVVSSLGTGLLVIISAFMPELISFTICKFFASMCLACPASSPYLYIGEILPQKYRDLVLSVINSMQIMGSAIVPLIAWAILPLEFRLDFGLYEFRPWRLLCLLYSTIFLISAGMLSLGLESPKYLVSQGKHDEALKVLQYMYSVNKRTSPENFPIKAIKMPEGQREKVGLVTSLKVQSLPLLTPPFLKWVFLNGFLLFGVFNILNGLYTWVPDVLNRVLTGGGASNMTACDVIRHRNTTVAAEDCDDTIDTITFMINSIASIACAFLALAISTSVKIIGKKMLAFLTFFILGLFSICINLTTKEILFAILLSTLPLAALAIGPINAFSVEIFPTKLRGMAVSLTMMLGRIGSIVGANVAGAMIVGACEPMFYMFGGLFILCSILTFLLPRSQNTKGLQIDKEDENMTGL